MYLLGFLIWTYFSSEQSHYIWIILSTVVWIYFCDADEIWRPSLLLFKWWFMEHSPSDRHSPRNELWQKPEVSGEYGIMETKGRGNVKRIEQVSANQMLLLVSHGVWGLRVEYGFNDKGYYVPLENNLVEQAVEAVGREGEDLMWKKF